MCYGLRHVWSYTAAETGQPPRGMACVCGGYVWEAATQGVLATDGVTTIALADEVMPSGICPRCNRPLDDHTSDRNGWLCPKVTA